MTDKIADVTIRCLIKNNLLKESETELYRFGIKQLLSFCINIATTIGIGILLGMVWQSIVFSFAYIPLRRYAGGYHAKTPGKCYALSTLLVFSELQLTKYFKVNMYIMIISTMISIIIIYLKAPVASENKPLSAKEKLVYRKNAMTILLLELLLMCLLLPFFIEGSACIALSIICSAIMLVIY